MVGCIRLVSVFHLFHYLCTLFAHQYQLSAQRGLLGADAQGGQRGAHHQQAGEGNGVGGIGAEKGAVNPAEGKGFDQHRHHNHHIDNAHIHAVARFRNFGHGNQKRHAHNAGPGDAEAYHRHKQQVFVADVRKD